MSEPRFVIRDEDLEPQRDLYAEVQRRALDALFAREHEALAAVTTPELAEICYPRRRSVEGREPR